MGEARRRMAAAPVPAPAMPVIRAADLIEHARLDTLRRAALGLGPAVRHPRDPVRPHVATAMPSGHADGPRPLDARHVPSDRAARVMVHAHAAGVPGASPGAAASPEPRTAPPGASQAPLSPLPGPREGVDGVP